MGLVSHKSEVFGLQLASYMNLNVAISFPTDRDANEADQMQLCCYTADTEVKTVHNKWIFMKQLKWQTQDILRELRV